MTKPNRKKIALRGLTTFRRDGASSAVESTLLQYCGRFLQRISTNRFPLDTRCLCGYFSATLWWKRFFPEVAWPLRSRFCGSPERRGSVNSQRGGLNLKRAVAWFLPSLILE